MQGKQQREELRGPNQRPERLEVKGPGDPQPGQAESREQDASARRLTAKHDPERCHPEHETGSKCRAEADIVEGEQALISLP